MTQFVVYDPGTGRILRSGHCSAESDVALQPGPGEAVIPTDQPAPGNRFRVDVSADPPVVVAL